MGTSDTSLLRSVGERIRDQLLLQVGEGDAGVSSEVQQLRVLSDEAISVLQTCANWDAAVGEIVQPIVTAFAAKSDSWKRLVHVASRGLRAGLSTIRNARATGTTTKNRAGETLFFTQTGIPCALVVALFMEASEDDRESFLASVDDWTVLVAISEALPDLSLAAPCIVGFARAAYSIAKGDMGASQVFSAVRAWADRNAATARLVIEARLSGTEMARDLPLEFVQLLVERVIASRPPDWEPWRTDVLRKLREGPSESDWGLAMYLACFAWPDPPPPVEHRLAALVADVRRIPRRLGGAGLSAAARVAMAHPVLALRTAHEIYRLARSHPEPPAVDFDAAFANVAFMAMQNAKRAGVSPTELRYALEDLLEIAPGGADFLLDSFLHELVTADPESVRQFLGRWMSQHSVVLRGAAKSLEDRLNMTMTALAPATRARWYLGWIASSDRVLRTVGSQMLEKAEYPLEITEEVLRPFTTEEVQGLVHQLCGALAAMGSVWIPALMDIAEFREDAFPVVREILVDEGVLDFPGVSDREVESRLCRATQSGGAGLPSRLTDTLTAMRERQDALQRVHDEKMAIPEILAIRPATHLWASAFHRKTQIARDEAMSHSPLLGAISMMPIGRGDSYDPGTPGSAPTGFKRFSAEYESPGRHETDNVTWAVARIRHITAASALLDRAESGNA